MTGTAVFQVELGPDKITPFIQGLIEGQSPSRIAAAIGPACANLVKANYQKQPPNKQGFPSTGFWADAIRATRWEPLPDGVMIITDKIGVRQRYFGGIIEAGKGISSKTGRPTKYIIAYANTPEAYGKLPSELGGLKFVRFGRGQDAPAALVAVRATATNIEKGKKGFKATSEQIGLVVLYWLKRKVNQPPNPGVLPTSQQMGDTMGQALQDAFTA